MNRRMFACIFVVALFLGCVGDTHAQTLTQERAALQAQLDQIEKDISEKKGVLSDLQQQRTTLERDISILNNKIKTAQLQIKKSDLAISQLQGDITEKQSAIVQVDRRVSDGQRTLAEMLRRQHAIDETPLVTIALTSGAADTFRELDEAHTVQEALHESFSEMQVLRKDLSTKKDQLEDKQDEVRKVKSVQVLAKQAIQSDQQEKNKLLSTTKGVEKTYQQLIADREKQAAQIRTALFGLRDSKAIPFGTAYQYAKEASQKTGVRPALTLAILTQETNLGANVGSCYVQDIQTGRGIGKNTGRVFATVMKAPRDTVPFRAVTDALGLDWSTTLVSCPQATGGYGGAMGPAQFIPSTWVLYQKRLANTLGVTTPNPWDGRTAVFATSLLMSDNGADAGTRAEERKAALKYFAGGNWSKSAYAFYGDNVMAIADRYQADIDILEAK